MIENKWSGRRDSNPRRPAWEIDRRLKIQTIASMASTDGDRNTPSFNDLLQGSRKWSKNGAKEKPGMHAASRCIKARDSIQVETVKLMGCDGLRLLGSAMTILLTDYGSTHHIVGHLRGDSGGYFQLLPVHVAFLGACWSLAARPRYRHHVRLHSRSSTMRRFGVSFYSESCRASLGVNIRRESSCGDYDVHSEGSFSIRERRGSFVK